jgi:predicted AlkP superfamily pyrophosphatase or phosphodiesterase
MGSLGPGEVGEVEKPNINGKVIAQDEDMAKYKKASERIANEVEMVKKTNTYGEPFHNIKSILTVWDGDKSRIAQQVGPLDLDYLDKYGKGRFFAFFHFSDPDHRGHAKGENSVQYNNSLIECDKWLGNIIKKLKDLGIYDKTAIYVTADHGFDEGKTTHDNAPYVFFASNDPSLSKNGDQRDVAPTILAAMGADLAKISPSLPGKILTK